MVTAAKAMPAAAAAERQGSVERNVHGVQPASAQPTASAQPAGAQPVCAHTLAVENVRRMYEDAQGRPVLALDGLTLHMSGAEIVGLVGPSGCGKSTLLRLLAGLDQPQAGALLYDGAPIEGPHYTRGLVFQEAALYDWLTVEENIAFGLKARKVYKGNEQRVHDYIRMMGLTGFEKSYPYQISGGMASRCALARTFIQNPGLILLDEPLSALDAFTRAGLQDEIVRMHQSSQAMFLLVTHDIEEAVYLCDRVLVMSPRPGRIVAEVAVDLPHPRDRMAPDFVEKRKEILQLLQWRQGAADEADEGNERGEDETSK